MDNKAIGCYLLHKRKEVGKTQKELADHFGVTYQAVSRWENGESIPDIETLAMIADYYDVSIDEILQREIRVKKKDPNEFDPSSMMWLMFLISVGAYVIGYFVHVMFVSFDLETIGYVCYVLFALAGIITMNAYFFTFQYYDYSSKTTKDWLWYLIQYVPLIVLSLLII